MVWWRWGCKRQRQVWLGHLEVVVLVVLVVLVVVVVVVVVVGCHWPVLAFVMYYCMYYKKS